MKKQSRFWLPILLVGIATVGASAQSFRVQCPTTTVTHPANLTDVNAEPAYTGPTTLTAPSNTTYQVPSANVNGAIKCQQIAGGDGFATMGDGTQTYMFSFGPLSGLADIANGLPGTEFPAVFNTVSPLLLKPGDPATYDAITGGGPNGATGFPYNGAVGLTGDPAVLAGNSGGAVAVATVAGGIVDSVTITNEGTNCPAGPGPYIGMPAVTFSDAPTGGTTALGKISTITNGCITAIDVTYTGTGYTTAPTVTIGPASNLCSGANPPSQCLTGHVDSRPIMDVGVMNGNIPAPLMALDEDDEFFLTLTNIGMIMRPDLFEQHTVHFHGYPNASSFFDGVPDASVAINIGGSFTYYYLAPDAGTYFWHCHITPPEHLQMGMVGQIYVRPRQNRVPNTMTLYAGLQAQQSDARTKCDSARDILCSNPLPAGGDDSMTGGFMSGTATKKFAYNDGDGSTQYEVEYPIQIHGFDPNFHFVGMTFNPEGFVDMKDKFFLLNGRSYPDTVMTGPMATQTTDGTLHYSQPLPSIINIPAGGRALLRISDLDVTEFQTLASLGIPMKVIAINAKLLRDQAGNNLYYNTNSITLGGGESLDVILDTCTGTRDSSGNCPAGAAVQTGTYYLYTPNLDHLSNDAENFGGLMTEVRVN